MDFDRNQHEARINRLIPDAVRYANDNAEDPWVWDRIYHDEMNRLTAAAGLRSIGGYTQVPGGYRE